ncbi:MAG TPA: NADP-dependent oxidoreductase [Pseudonocardia sp.]|jgi:NADPH:quinone reductase-like Zn-dependent oxidoreductase|uniref:quinone oxidoreductase family protein n=1 Tax=Pseudonocardia sp. TaxID=60912 RepID=UPI002EDAE4EE
MRAVGVREFGGPEVLRVLELPDPEPAKDEVLIRVHAAAVNPTDTMLRTGATVARFNGRQPPYVPGMDAAGVVERLGSGVDDRLRVGQRVIALVVPYGPRGGAYAERIVVPAASVVPAPEGADFPAAATLLMNAMTARVALNLLALRPGQTLAVTGAAGAFGGYAVQLAKADGLRVIADAAPADEGLVRALGADEVVARGDDVADRIRKLAPNGVDGLADGAVLHHLALPAIADGGQLAVVRGWSGPADRDITVHPVVVANSAADTAALDRLARQAEDGTLTLRVARVLPAAEAAEAHRQLAAGGIRGRLVLDLATGLADGPA